MTVTPVHDTSRAAPETSEKSEQSAIFKRLERELALANKKLDLMNCIAWHEIENKIIGARGYVELSKELVKDNKGVQYFEAQEGIFQQIHELLQLTKDYQRIGTRSPRWVNVHKSIRSGMCFVDEDAFRMDLEVAASLELFGDPTLELLFLALIQNTLKNKKTNPKIRIAGAEIPGGFRLTYEDNSVGIPVERKKRVFTEKIVKSENFCMKFVHDILEISGMDITENGTYGSGLRFEISVPEGLYRFGTGAYFQKDGYR